MDIEEKITKDVDQIICNAQNDNDQARDMVQDLLTFVHYGETVLSQFGMGYCGFSCRQSRTNVLMTVKVTEGDTPLVAFVTSSTTTGCIEKFLDLLFESKLKWQKDRYPWI